MSLREAIKPRRREMKAISDIENALRGLDPEDRARVLAAVTDQNATCRALVEAQQRADTWESKCLKWSQAHDAAQVELTAAQERAARAQAEVAGLLVQLDALAAEHSAALAGVSRALQESQAQRDDLASQLDAAREEIATYQSWWPFEVIGSTVFVALNEANAWTGIFQNAETAWQWVMETDPQHNVMTGELQGLRFWNSFDPAPSAQK
jgi:hypothetical protein